MKPAVGQNASILACLIVSFLIVGCEGPSKAERENKREQDRQAMRLADAERDRDNYKGQIDTLRSNLTQATDKQRAAEAQLSRAQADLAAARSGQASADQLNSQLQEAQKKLTDSENRVREMQIQIDALKARQTPVAPANSTPSTPPVTENNNK